MKKIAIACQGGGSHTAFTAGVLKFFLYNYNYLKKEKKYDIVSLSGTSGGAICAFFAWYALLKHLDDPNTPPDATCLQSFWEKNSTDGNIASFFMNSYFTNIAKTQEEGIFPHWEINPNSFFAKLWRSSYKVSMDAWHFFFPLFSPWLPPANYFDLRALLETVMPKDVEVETLRNKIALKGPTLLIGAVNVGNGNFKIFNSRKEQITIKQLMATTAIPTLFPAAEIENQYYWDGLFSDNPPTDELLDDQIVGDKNIPNELWIIQINPTTYDKGSQKRPQFPKSLSQIADRKNELSGNLSLFHDLKRIDKINELLKEHFNKKSSKEQDQYIDNFRKKYREVEIKIIRMPESLEMELDRASKINRDKTFLDKLIQEGENSGREFLRDTSDPAYSWRTVKESW